MEGQLQNYKVGRLSQAWQDSKKVSRNQKGFIEQVRVDLTMISETVLPKAAEIGEGDKVFQAEKVQKENLEV